MANPTIDLVQAYHDLSSGYAKDLLGDILKSTADSSESKYDECSLELDSLFRTLVLDEQFTSERAAEIYYAAVDYVGKADNSVVDLEDAAEA